MPVLPTRNKRVVGVIRSPSRRGSGGMSSAAHALTSIASRSAAASNAWSCPLPGLGVGPPPRLALFALPPPQFLDLFLPPLFFYRGSTHRPPSRSADCTVRLVSRSGSPATLAAAAISASISPADSPWSRSRHAPQNASPFRLPSVAPETLAMIPSIAASLTASEVPDGHRQRRRRRWVQEFQQPDRPGRGRRVI